MPDKFRTPRAPPQGKKTAAKRAPAKRVRAAPARREPAAATKGVIAYRSTKGVDDYVRQVARATPLQLVEIERQGVLGSFIKDLSRRMDIPSSRIFTILGVPKATAEKKAAAGERVEGSGGQAAIGMVRLLGIAQDIVANSTAREAKTFDATKWLGQWIERPQRALGGRKPAELMDTPTGTELVARLLGSIESGAYQ
jgi:putative toxin-antitoxin system antitoxin component (TIGR02293 family)